MSQIQKRIDALEAELASLKERLNEPLPKVGQLVEGTDDSGVYTGILMEIEEDGFALCHGYRAPRWFEHVTLSRDPVKVNWFPAGEEPPKIPKGCHIVVKGNRASWDNLSFSSEEGYDLLINWGDAKEYTIIE